MSISHCRWQKKGHRLQEWCPELLSAILTPSYRNTFYDPQAKRCTANTHKWELISPTLSAGSQGDFCPWSSVIPRRVVCFFRAWSANSFCQAVAFVLTLNYHMFLKKKKSPFFQWLVTIKSCERICWVTMSMVGWGGHSLENLDPGGQPSPWKLWLWQPGSQNDRVKKALNDTYGQISVHGHQVCGLRHGLKNSPIFLKIMSLSQSITSVTRECAQYFCFCGELFLLAVILTPDHWLWSTAWLYSLANKAYLYPES